ncbi:MAG: hypothetical protein Kow0031_13560 [Anaerolineae bacterium]
MRLSVNRRKSAVFIGVGGLLVAVGLLLSAGLLTALAGALDIPLAVGGLPAQVRLWLAKLVLLVAGLLLLYPFRFSRVGKTLFDVVVGLLLLLVTLFLIEGGFGLLNRWRSQSVPGEQPQLRLSGMYARPDEQFGFVLLPGAVVTATETMGDRLIYQVQYSITDQGRRPVPVTQPVDRQRFALFFGGSFIFGDGLADDEQLPYYLGQLAPGYTPYNFGVSGYGPTQALAQLQFQDLPAEVTQSEGIAIYTYICAHISRVVGTMERVNSFGGNMPYFALGPNNRAEYRGDFGSVYPQLPALYAVLGMSETVKYFNLSFPPITDSHYRLTAAILAEMERELQRQFDAVDFYVLLYPGSGSCAPLLRPHLDELGVKYLDYSELLAGREPSQYFIPDGHPTSRAQQTVAEQLARDMGILGREMKADIDDDQGK